MIEVTLYAGREFDDMFVRLNGCIEFFRSIEQFSGFKLVISFNAFTLKYPQSAN